MRKIADRGWLGITWPEEWGGQNGDGIYEYVLDEALAGRGGPQIGRGVGIIGKTLLAVGSEKLKAEFLPKILRNEVEFAVGYSEPEAGSDAASMKLRATRDDARGGWVLNGQKTWTTSAHFAEWYWVGARTDWDAAKHFGITLFLVPLDHPNVTVRGIWTMGDERTNDVFFDDVFVSDDYVVGELNKGFQYISQALDLERFTMFSFAPIAQRLDLLTDYVKTATRDDEPLSADPVVRQKMATLATEAEVARLLGLRVVDAATRAGAAAHHRGVRVQALRHRAVQAPRQCVDGPRRTGHPAQGGHRGSPHEGPRRVDVPLHGARHHRRRYLRGAEEHHLPSQARTPEELLTSRLMGSELLEGITVLDLASVGPRPVPRAGSPTTARTW
ncbi:acyl-CoA dehydrogenase family protein [Yinghuangia aomiensis]